ncbi:amino acid adenylation domain-containing protein [Streptomyces sp. NPDC048290]|uniref:amino acid adenylation domain-containing protein n=1 Tax=Streptomyces sp. NPDC048290 TaxID=3155811 RepID=UPI00342289AE
MTQNALDPRIALDFWVRRLGDQDVPDLPSALSPSDPADGRRHQTLTLTDTDLGYLRKASRGDARAEAILHITLYRLLLSWSFGPESSAVAVTGPEPTGGAAAGPETPAGAVAGPDSTAVAVAAPETTSVAVPGPETTAGAPAAPETTAGAPAALETPAGAVPALETPAGAVPAPESPSTATVSGPRADTPVLHTTPLDPDATLRAAIDTTRAESLACAPYRDYPWDDLLRWTGGPGAGPGGVRFGLVCGAVPVPHPWLATGTALLLTVPSGPYEREITLSYGPGCDERLAAQFLRHYARLVRGLRNHLDRPLNRVPVLTPAETSELTGALTGPPPEPGLPASLLEDLRRQVAATPDAIAVVDADGTLTYRLLDEHANQLAHFLRDEHGIGRGDFVGVALPDSRDLLVAILAVLKAGAAYVPIDLRYPPDRQSLLVRESGAAAVVVREPGDLAGPAPNVVALARHADRIARSPKTAPAVEIRADDSVYVIFTSGSTGTPKGVAVEHGAFRNLLAWYTREVCGDGAGDAAGRTAFLLIAPVSFDLAQKNLFAPLLRGGRLHLLGAALDDYSAMARYIDTHAVDVVNCAPSAFYPLLEFGADRDFHALRSLRHVVLGGEPIDTAKLTAWTASPHCRAQIMNSYGPTEFTDVVSHHRLDAADLRPDGGPVPIGRPVDGIHLIVLSPQQRLCPPHLVGELYLGGAGLSKGYLNDPDEQARRFVRAEPAETGFDGVLYRTGDLVRCDAEHRLVYLGRADDQIKVNGFRIAPGEVERAVRAVDGVRDAAVCLKPVRGEDVLVAYYIADAPLDRETLRERTARTLPAFAVPTHFVPRTAFPLTPSGKLDKRALPPPGDDLTGGYEPPATPAEKRLARLWAELLGRERVGRHDDFFALGGHSLTAVRLLSYVSRDFGAALSLTTVFEHSRLDDLAAVLAAAGPGRYTGIPRLAPADDHAPSHAQRRLWLTAQFAGASAAYNLHAVYEIRGEIDAERLAHAFLRVIGKHESLRTVFRTGADGDLRQVVRPATETGFRLDRLLSTDDDALLEFTGRPFDLERGPLLRAALARTGDGTHVLAFVIHHSVCDAWSLGVFASDLLKFYDPAPTGPPIARLDLQYKDYAAWQHTAMASAAHDAHRRFWRDTLAGLDTVPPVDLPGCRPRPAVRTHHGALVRHTFPAPFAARLDALAARRGCTLFMVLVAALDATLYRQTGQPDIVLGTPVAGRDHVDLEDQIGFYVNTLPLRTALTADDTFATLLAKVKAGVTGALEHQAHPFDAILDDLAPRRDPSRSPLFDLLVVLQNATGHQALDPVDGPDFQLRRRPAPRRSSKFDATFDFADRGPDTGLALEVEYNTDLYDEDSVRRFIGALETLLTDACDHPDRPLTRLRCVPAAERRRVLDDFGRGRPDPDCVPFLTRLADRCAASATAPALHHADRTVTYAQLDARSDQFAGFLTAELGVRPGDRVGILLDRDDWLVACLIGVLKTGAAYVPLDPAYPARRIAFIRDDAGCRTVVDAALVHRFRERLGSWPAAPAARPSPDALAYVIYTSGSTGDPKGVQITHDNLAAFLQWSLREFADTDIGVVFAATSLCFDLSVFELFFSLTAGLPVRIVESPAHIGDWLGAHRRVLINTVPSVVEELVRAGHDLAQVTAVNVAGEPAPPALRDLLDLRRTEVRNLYGPSEDTTYSTVYRFDDSTTAVPIGRPVDNTRVYVLDPAGQPAGIGVTGEIHLSGRGLSRGYVNRPRLDAEAFTEHSEFPGERLYRTGDHGRWQPDGNLVFLGRRDAQVKIRGRRIELGEVEAAVRRLPGVRQAAVVVHGEGATAALAAYYATDGDPIEPADIRNALRTTLPGYLVPAAISRLDAFPLTPNGKVDRRALPAPAEPVAASAVVAPASPLEARVLDIWRSVVDAPGAGVDDSYFELGGDSLRAMSLIARLNQELGSALRISDLYHHPTVRTLTAQLGATAPAPPTASPPPTGTPGTVTAYPITTSQAGIYYLQRLDPRSTAYNIPLSFAVHGPLDETRLRKAIGELVRRHDAFRTRFTIRDRQVVGLVEPTAEVPIERQCLRPGEESDLLRGFVRPFDLAEAPLMRVKIASGSDEEHHLALDIHHLVFDGASVALLLAELVRLYTGDTVPEVPGPGYAAHAQLTARAGDEEERARQRAYWLDRLGGDRPPLALPFDFPRGTVQRFSGDYVELSIDAERRGLLESLARSAGTTVFSALFSLFAGVLAHIGGQDDITLGIPVECRRDPRVRSTIGMFVNTLAVRVAVDRARPVRDLLSAHAGELFTALDHQEYPFETLVRDLRAQRDDQPPLFDAMFAYYPRLPVEDLFPGTDLTVAHYHVDRPRISKFPLTFLVDETEDGLRVSLNYDSSLFRAETAQAMAEVVDAAFDLPAAPERPLSTLPPL